MNDGKNKIYVLCGKTCSGKSSIEMAMTMYGYCKAISCCTRPIRSGEKDGKDYYFMDNQTFLTKIDNNEFVECRLYKGKWYYGLEKTEIDLTLGNWVVVADLYGFKEIKEYYGSENVVGIYIYADDRERVLRYLMRDSDCDIQEMFRRFLKDEEDFSKKEVYECKFDLAVKNENKIVTLNKILAFIKEYSSHVSV